MPIKKPLEIEMELETIGKTKAELNFASVFVLAVLAGVYIGFGGALATLVSHDLATYVGVGFSKIVAGAVFSIGLVLVILGGAELFTGNNLLIIPIFTKKITFKQVARNWGLVYLGNFVGSVILVGLIFVSGYWKLNNNAVGVAAL